MFHPIITALIPISLVCQVVFVSIVFPRNLVHVARRAVIDRSNQPDSQQVLQRRYVLINRVIAAFALVCLLICASVYLAGAMPVTYLLLSMGMIFLVQVAPLAMVFYHGLLPIEQNPDGDIDDLASANPVPGLLTILPVRPILLAGGLYLAYVVTLGGLWICSGANPLPKIVSLTFTNLIFALTILRSYRALATKTDERAARYGELVRMGPMIVFASILVTMYFFAKEVLLALDLHEARPIMMSVALQLVALAVFHLIGGNGTRTRA